MSDKSDKSRKLTVALPLLLLLAPLSVGADTLVVANKAEATASLIDLDSGEVVATLPTGNGPHEVAVSPDGRLALVTDYGNREGPGSTVTVIDVPAARVVETIDLGEHRRPHGVEWLDGRRALVTAEGSRKLLVVDVEEGEVTAAIDTGQEVSHMVAATPDGRRAFVANIGSGSVTAIDLAEGKRIEVIETGDGAEGIDVTPDGTQVWVTNRGADTVTVLDASSLEELAELESEGFPIRARATPDGRRVLVTNARAAELAVFDPEELALARRLEVGVEVEATEGRLMRFGGSSLPIGVLVDPESRTAFIAHANGDVITELDLESWEVRRTLTAGKEPDGMGYSELDVEGEGE